IPVRKMSECARRLTVMKAPYECPPIPMRSRSATPMSTILSTAACALATSCGMYVSFGSFSAGANDRHCRAVEYAVAVHEQHQVVLAGGALELIRGPGELRSSIGRLKLTRISPEEKGKPAVRLVVARRKIQRRRELHAVGPRVSNELALHIGEVRRRIA